MVKECSNCGTVNSASSSFCSGCGTALNGRVAVATPPTTVYPVKPKRNLFLIGFIVSLLLLVVTASMVLVVFMVSNNANTSATATAESRTATAASDLRLAQTGVANQTATASSQQTAAAQTATAITQQTQAAIANQTATAVGQQTAAAQTATAVVLQTQTAVANQAATAVAVSTANAQATLTAIADANAQASAERDKSFNEAKSKVDAGAWGEAITALQNFKSRYPDQKTDYVNASLARSFCGYGLALHTNRDKDINAVIFNLKQCAELNPRYPQNQQFDVSGPLATEQLYKDGLDAYYAKNWQEVVNKLSDIYNNDKAYRDVPKMLFEAYITIGDRQAAQKNYTAALDSYGKAENMLPADGVNPTAAKNKREYIMPLIPTPTPQPTATPAMPPARLCALVNGGNWTNLAGINNGASGSHSDDGYCLFSTASRDSFTFSGTVIFSDGEEAGLVFRAANDPKNRSYQVILNTKKGQVEFVKMVDGQSKPLAGNYPVKLEKNTRYTVRVEASGNRFWVYLNNATRPIFEVSDLQNPYSAGAFGLNVYNATADFSNLTIGN